MEPELDPNLIALLHQIQAKYSLEDQAVAPYLEGLLHANYLDYWDYIQTDALLNLQVQRTLVPDEMVFIIYHQITELYFKLCLWEFKQISDAEPLSPTFFTQRVDRINAYFANLTRSFEIMVNGMEKEQFLKFRLTLMPASGFQSAQYRMIEFASTDLINLVAKDHRPTLKNASIEELYSHIYWKFGATELDTGKRTLTLRRFEEKYSNTLIDWAKAHISTNLSSLYSAMSDLDKSDPDLIAALRKLDMFVNVRWPLMHFKSAARYLKRDPEDVAATGGTNWQQYLAPRMQLRVFFPYLWSETELLNWGTSLPEDGPL